MCNCIAQVIFDLSSTFFRDHLEEGYQLTILIKALKNLEFDFENL